MKDRTTARQVECLTLDDSIVSANQRATERIESWGTKPLPVFPSQPSTAKPGQKPDNKAPRRKGSDGKLYRLTKAQQQQPELAWMDGAEGVGYLVPEGMVVADFDRKHFKSDAACKDAVDQFIAENGLSKTYVSKTMNGGRHVGPLRSEKLLAHENFGINNIEHCGELRGPGSFVIESGPGYKQVQAGEILTIPEIKGIFKAKKKGNREGENNLNNAINESSSINRLSVRIEDIISKSNRDIYEGKSKNSKTDRSRDYTAFAKEALAIEEFAAKNGYETNSIDDLLIVVAERVGISKDRADRILKSIEGKSYMPAMLKKNGGDESKLLAKFKKACKSSPNSSLREHGNTIFLKGEDTPGLVALRELCPDEENWKTINGDIYRFNGTYYEKIEDAFLASKINHLHRRCIEVKESKNGTSIKRPYAKSTQVRDALEFCRSAFKPIPLDNVNPTGAINCKNGVLLININESGDDIKLELIPHSPTRVFTYEPLVPYEPDADSEHCNRLLDALRDEHREAVLRVLAAALDLPKIRALKGRAVKTLFFTGQGANGKDSLREAFTAILGKTGVSACSIQDFKLYDQGRRFGLASLGTSRCNWASENDVSSRIDKLQSLKQAVTGDTLQAEPKNVQGQDFNPRCVLIFNTNEAPNLVGKSQASSSRYVVVPFNKTYSDNPSRPNEILADPRFKFDMKWVHKNVCPALLNRLILELKAFLKDGIDYSCFEATMEENRLESSHLYRWLSESNFVVDPDGRIESEIVWQQLRSHYKQEGCLDENERWGEDPRPGDRLVRTKMQLVKRLRPYIPEIKSEPINGKRYICGLRLKNRIEIEEEKQKVKDSLDNQDSDQMETIPLDSTLLTQEEVFKKAESYSGEVVNQWINLILKSDSKDELDKAIRQINIEDRQAISFLVSEHTEAQSKIDSLGFSFIPKTSESLH